MFGAMRYFLSPENFPWEAHDINLVTLDVTQSQMDMMEAIVFQVACVA
jgi:hypothetical protein